MASKLESVARFITSVFLLAVFAMGAWALWNHFEKDRVISDQRRIIAALEQKLDRMWAEELVADVRVDSIARDAAGVPQLNLTFVRYRPGTEEPEFRSAFTVQGDEFYVDALVVQFERKLVEQGDGLAGRSLLLFRRIFGDRQRPVDGAPLYRHADDSDVPAELQVDVRPTEFERALWSRFWQLANDPRRAAAAGVRVAQGEAPHVKAVSGQVYKLTLRAAGGLTITPRLPSAVVGTGTP